MKRICAVMIGLALLIATPGVATADATHQKLINLVIQRALSQRGVPFAYGGGTVSGASLGTVAVETPVDPAAPALGTTQLPATQPPPTQPLPTTVGATGLSLSPVTTPAPAAEQRVSRVGFDASGLIVYAFAGAGIKMPRSSGEQYKVGQKVLPSQALPGDLLFYGPDGTQSVALFIGNGQMVEATDTGVAVSPVRTNNMAPYLSRIIA
ncbi:cell wall-associated hydrolase, invasion-associated protein [Mycobacterium sp. JS623]|uniref:NlpC/P60 family peptidoglycan-binding protein RipD n=1 Tax=Mycobacterium sp. JS623 TaxID=212767 RepID=UPI0002A5B973|nr:NlpC/P60 family peptidoglycan-binding protein RipD [Mycobacterium sp. JS623]AGB23781.1 cell wall-associated hydrolase, invasion-associated protein [Mycobacterium sp. JS623]